jgi:hypothetical protein
MALLAIMRHLTRALNESLEFGLTPHPDSFHVLLLLLYLQVRCHGTALRWLTRRTLMSDVGARQQAVCLHATCTAQERTGLAGHQVATTQMYHPQFRRIQA